MAGPLWAVRSLREMRRSGSWRSVPAGSAPSPAAMGALRAREYRSAPPVPSSSGTGVAAHSVLKSGSNRLLTGRRAVMAALRRGCTPPTLTPEVPTAVRPSDAQANSPQ